MSKEISDSVRLTYLNDAAFWRRLMRKLSADLRDIESADKALLAKRPVRTEVDFDAISAKEEARTTELKEAVRKAKALPDGWFRWTKTSKNKELAIKAARHALRVWRATGRDRFMRSEFASVETMNRRRARKTAKFDARADVRAASARLAAMPGVLAEVDGAAKADEALFAALAPVVRDDGRIIKIHIGPAFDLLRQRAVLLAAMMEASAEAEPEHTEKAGKPDDFPTFD
ncbi:hypothetical protein [Nguyenibacter sp. L1]|uniref:hypothetical protein n=1 Tax=Nguyenibacter sp. L1 TaxID=3049350 RepID=UPI002B48F7D0|nr:hypothetical protein [Nguyenibacter sp. L1]WRH89575.1 hypothetical protein QN315_08295 [Nguyenibacter sp. L1]